METIVVCGGTGTQGSAVVAALRSRARFRVAALTRDPGAPSARALASAGVTLLRGDFHAPHTLRAAFAGAAGVFAMTQPWSRDYRHADVAAEIAAGTAIVEAAKAAHVAHLVFSTALDLVGKPTGIPHVDSKRVIEAHLRASGLSHTILRPATFMDNLGKGSSPSPGAASCAVSSPPRRRCP